MKEYVNPEISNKKTLLQLNQSDEQNQQLLKLIQQRSNLPYGPAQYEEEKFRTDVADKVESQLQTAFDISMKDRFEKEMTPEAKALYEDYKKREFKRRVIKEQRFIEKGIGLPTI